MCLCACVCVFYQHACARLRPHQPRILARPHPRHTSEAPDLWHSCSEALDLGARPPSLPRMCSLDTTLAVVPREEHLRRGGSALARRVMAPQASGSYPSVMLHCKVKQKKTTGLKHKTKHLNTKHIPVHLIPHAVGVCIYNLLSAHYG